MAGINHVYTYDAEERLLTVDGSTSYIYDGEGDRVAKVVNGAVQTEYLYDALHRPLAEIGPDFNLARGNIYAGSELLAEDEPDPLAGPGLATMFRFTDAVGTLRALWDVKGNHIMTTTSLPFGDAQASSGSNPSDRFFTGKERTQNRDSTTSGLDTTEVQWAASCRRTGASRSSRFRTPNWTTRSR